LKVPVNVTGGMEVKTVPPNENGEVATFALDVAVNTKLCGVVIDEYAGKVCWVV